MKLKKRTIYSDNEKTHIAEEWIEDEDGRWQGESRWYYETGEIEAIAHWKDNKVHGVYTELKEDGNIKNVKYYWDDKEVSKSEFVFRSKLEGR